MLPCEFATGCKYYEMHAAATAYASKTLGVSFAGYQHRILVSFSCGLQD